MEEEGAIDSIWQKVQEGHLSVRELCETWGDAQSLKPTCLSD
jgi:hypothetical protein